MMTPLLLMRKRWHSSLIWPKRGLVAAMCSQTSSAMMTLLQLMTERWRFSLIWQGHGVVSATCSQTSSAMTKPLLLITKRWHSSLTLWQRHGCGRGNVFADLKRYDDAFAAYDKALALKPDLAEAWGGRGNVFADLKRHDDAFAAYDKALALKPDLIGIEGARLHSKMNICDWSNFSIECEHLISSVKNSKTNTAPFAFLAISASPEDQIKYAKLYTSKTNPRSDRPFWNGEVYRHNRIRIAYVSPDFHQHPVLVSYSWHVRAPR